MKTLVIGGSCGFGAALTDEFRRVGHDVVTVGRSGGDYICDVSHAAAWSQVTDRIVSDHGVVDFLVCVSSATLGRSLRPN